MPEKYLLNGFWSKQTSVIFLGQGVEEIKEFEHTLVFKENNKKLIFDDFLRWSPATINITPNKKLIIICTTGEYFIKNNDEYIENIILDMPIVTDSCFYNKDLYICGVSSKIYKFIDDDNWHLDSKELEEGNNFTCINGNKEKLMVVGLNGVCYLKKENYWQEEPLPTNQNLSCICIEQDQIVITGQSGTLLIGLDDEWHVIEHKYPLDDFWLVSFFEGKFYISGNSIVYLLDKKDGNWDLNPVYAWNIEEGGIVSDMFVEKGTKHCLWIVSEKSLAYLELDKWTKLF